MQLRIATLFCALALCLPIAGQTVYETGFEPPLFTVGPIGGQNGWANAGGGAGNHLIQNVIVKSGTQAGEINNSGVTGENVVLSPEVDLDINNYPGQDTIHIQEDIYIASANPHADWTIEPLAPPFGDFTAYQIQPDGHVHFVEGNTDRDTGVAFPYDTWNTIAIDLNFTTRTVTAYLNGATIISGFPFAPFSGTSTILKYVGQGALVAGNEQFYFDNFSISTSNPLYFLWFFLS
jgi:hypothetical protein